MTPGSPPSAAAPAAQRSEWMDRKTRLRRVGDRIHRADCRYGNGPKSLPWLWAEDVSDAEVRLQAVEQNGLAPCRVCKPLGVPS